MCHGKRVAVVVDIHPLKRGEASSYACCYPPIQVKATLSSDLSLVLLSAALIYVTNRPQIINDTTGHLSLYPIYFELMSAFTTVGLTYGYPTSLCTQFNWIGKAVVVVMMAVGRYTNLPPCLVLDLVPGARRTKSVDEPSANHLTV